jgi:hypothetical protein
MAITLTICEAANIAINPVVPATVVINPNLPGVTATVEVGTTTTGAPGADAEVVNSGTAIHAIFDFTIPRGEQGIQGIQGIQGLQGLQGIQGVSGQKGDKGDTGDTGPAGVMYADSPLYLDTESSTLSIDLSGYATQTWVTDQGYLTSGALDGYATESFVTSQGYITASALDGYATESYVNTAVGGRVNKTGDTMTGQLTVEFGPTVGRSDIYGGTISLNGAGDYFGFGINISGIDGILTVTNPNDGYMTMNPTTGIRFADGTYQSTAASSGVPIGGTTGQSLVKASNTNYDTTWTTIQTGDRYLTTSTTSLTLSNGAKTLTVATGLAYTTQQDFVIAYDASHHMHCVVTSYNSTTGVLVADVHQHTGSGTFSSWTVNVGGTTTAVLPTGGTTAQILQKSSNTDFDVSWTTPYSGSDSLKIASNLSDLNNTTTARTNLGLGTMATQTAANYALLAGPTFTGVPAAPTATSGTNTTQIATTAFVTTAVSTKANLASPTFTGTVTIPAGASISGYLTTATAASTYAPISSPTFTGTVTIPAGASISGFALLASPTFTGVPAAPTATSGTNTTQLATTAFVTTAISTKANLASPTFTGTVTIPSGASISGYLTSATAASTYQTQAGMSSYLTISTAASTYAPIASPTFTGTVTIPAGASISGYLTSSTAASTYQTQAGMSSYLTTSAASSTYYLQTNPSGFITSSALTGYATESWVGTQGFQTAGDVSTYVTGLGYQTAGDVSTYVTGLGYLTDAPSDGDQYARQNGAWAVVTGGGGSYLPLAGGTMDANAEVTLSDTSNHDSEMAGWGFGVQLTSDHAQGTTVEYNGLNTYDSSGNLHINPTGITFPDATVQTTAGYPNTNPSGFQTSSDVSTYVTGLGYLTDAPVDGFAYNRKDGAWEVAGSGGSVAWGAISGTLSDQTDLNTALTTLQTNVDAKQNKSTLVTVSTSSDYYATSASENGVIYLDPSSNGITTVYLPDGYSGTEFANGCSVTVINRSGGMSPVGVQAYGGAFAHIIYGTNSIINGYSMTFYKIDGNDWFGQA